MNEKVETSAHILSTSALRGFGLAFGAWVFLRGMIELDAGLW